MAETPQLDVAPHTTKFMWFYQKDIGCECHFCTSSSDATVIYFALGKEVGKLGLKSAVILSLSTYSLRDETN